MDVASYLLGKKANSGSGGDVSEYFYTKIDTNNTGNATRPYLLKKTPLIMLTENVTRMEYLFPSAPIKKIAIGCTSKLTRIGNWFSNSIVEEVDLTQADFSNVTIMSYLNNGASKLKKIDFGDNTMSKVQNMQSVFADCSSLENLDLSKWQTANVTSYGNMFYGCTSLKNLDIRNFTFANSASYSGMFRSVPNDCKIIVKSNTEKSWILDRFTNLTNVVTVDELENE